MQEKCYREYTRICTKETLTLAGKLEHEEQLEEPEVGLGSFEKFEKLFKFVRNHVIEHEQSISIKLLREVCGLDKEDCRLRGKVKQKLLQEFKDELLFVTVSNNEAKIVVSKKVLTNIRKYLY